MRTVAVRAYGPPSIVTVETAAAPKLRDGEVLVRVCAASVTSGDQRFRTAKFPPGFGLVGRVVVGFTKPRRPVLGRSLSGTVEAVGAGVTDFGIGDAVAGFTGNAMGAHAELATLAATRLVRVPANVPHETAAAALFGGTSALYALRDAARVRSGERVLVNGASGEVGSAAVQLAVRAGAQVTGVTSTRNVDLVRSLGAGAVIDYSRHPLSEHTEAYDVVIDTVGNVSPALGRRLITAGGRVVLLVAGLADMLGARGGVKAGVAPERTADVETLLDCVADGTFTPVIDSRHPLEDATAAHEIASSGRKRGSVLLTP